MADCFLRRVGPAMLATSAGLACTVIAILAWDGETATAGLLLCAVVLAGLSLRLQRSPQAQSGVRPLSVGDRRRIGQGAASYSPDPTIVVDRRGVVLETNAGARALLPGLRTGHPLAFALRDPAVLDAIHRVAATGEDATAETGGPGSSAPVHEVRIRRLGEAAEPADATVALFFRDLSAERRLERMRVDFIANVSHELRTPLASLVGFIDTLQGAARNDPVARERFLAIMAAQAARMTRLIDDLLQLSRVELTSHVPPRGPLDLVATVSHMTEVLGPLARERNVEVELDLPSAPAVISGDRDEILRLVENLVENAVKYGGAGGRVEVSVSPAEAGGFSLVVRDHGPGIAPEHLPRLTERFYRADKTDSRAQGGTGLGLAIVKHIAAHHRARLAIESELGRGATFRVTFPAHAP